MFPGWLDAVSEWLPTRAGRDAVVSAVTGGGLPAGALLGLAVWSALLGALAVWAYRRDEGRRFS
jgi:ABC-2 type transport system permease protein